MKNPYIKPMVLITIHNVTVPNEIFKDRHRNTIVTLLMIVRGQVELLAAKIATESRIIVPGAGGVN